MALARIVREERGKPGIEVMGALGISNEIHADLVTDRRATINAPPGEILMAVANSSESLPSPPEVRTKTGIASFNLGHFRLFFLEKL